MMMMAATMKERGFCETSMKVCQIVRRRFPRQSSLMYIAVGSLNITADNSMVLIAACDGVAKRFSVRKHATASDADIQ